MYFRTFLELQLRGFGRAFVKSNLLFLGKGHMVIFDFNPFLVQTSFFFQLLNLLFQFCVFFVELLHLAPVLFFNGLHNVEMLSPIFHSELDHPL